MKEPTFDRRAFLGSSAVGWMLGPNEAPLAGIPPSRQWNQTPDAIGVDEVGPAFSTAEYEDRLRRVRERMAQDNIDLLWVMMPESMCYLHGFASSWYQGNSRSARSGTAVHVDHDKVIHFDSGYHSHLLEGGPGPVEIRYFQGEPIDFMVKELEANGWLGGTVGLEFQSYRPTRAISERFEEAFRGAGCTVVDGSDVLLQVRLVKSPQELVYIEEAAAICDIGLQAIAETLRPGVTELEVYGELMRAMYAAGGDTPALIQGVGVWRGGGEWGNGRRSHILPSRRRIKAGEVFGADVCGVVHRYHANANRSYVVGEPSAETIRDHKLSAGSFDVLCETAKPGVPLKEVNDALLDYYKATGLWGGTGWALGYELGISFPPDWVGNFGFTIREGGPSVRGVDADPAEWAFPVGTVTNWESLWVRGPLIDTIIYEADGPRRLSKVPLQMIAV